MLPDGLSGEIDYCEITLKVPAAIGAAGAAAGVVASATVSTAGRGPLPDVEVPVDGWAVVGRGSRTAKLHQKLTPLSPH
jgi:hypothetical protein